MRLYQNVRKRHSVDSGIRESAFLVLQIHTMSRHTSKEGSPRLLRFIVNVQVHPGAPLEHIYHVTCPETTCLRHRFLVCWLPILFFFFFGKECNLQAVSHRLLGFAETRQSKWDKEGYCSPMKVSHRLLRSEEAPEQGMHLHL